MSLNTRLEKISDHLKRRPPHEISVLLVCDPAIRVTGDRRDVLDALAQRSLSLPPMDDRLIPPPQKVERMKEIHRSLEESSDPRQLLDALTHDEFRAYLTHEGLIVHTHDNGPGTIKVATLRKELAVK